MNKNIIIIKNNQKKNNNEVNKLKIKYNILKSENNKLKIKYNKLENKLNLLETKLHKKSENNMLSLKIEKYSIDDKYIIKFLNKNSIKGDIQFYKKIYLNSYKHPIKCINNRRYQYWNNNTWIEDINANYIIETLKNNIKYCYLKVNKLINLENNIDQFISNQTYIDNMNNESYKKNLLKNLKIILNEI